MTLIRIFIHKTLSFKSARSHDTNNKVLRAHCARPCVKHVLLFHTIFTITFDVSITVIPILQMRKWVAGPMLSTKIQLS